MDLTIVISFVAFFAMIVAWIAAPTAGARQASPAAHPSTPISTEAHA